MSNGSDKTEVTSADEWMRILESKEISRTSMNKLIMNYLVIGEVKSLCPAALNFENLDVFSVYTFDKTSHVLLSGNSCLLACYN